MKRTEHAPAELLAQWMNAENAATVPGTARSISAAAWAQQHDKNNVERWAPLKARATLSHVISVQFEYLLLSRESYAIKEAKIFQFIREYAVSDLDDLIVASQRNHSLKGYCKDARLIGFWEEIDARLRAEDDVTAEPTQGP